jgi:hypothetical protein
MDSCAAHNEDIVAMRALEGRRIANPILIVAQMLWVQFPCRHERTLPFVSVTSNAKAEEPRPASDASGAEGLSQATG